MVLASLIVLMAPLVTLPPVAPDAPNFAQMSATGQAGTGVSAGPWFIPGALGGGAWYTWLEPFAGEAVEVLKSTDGRLTWSIVGGSSGLIEGPCNAFYPGTGTVIYFVGVTSSGGSRPPVLQTFDAASDSYGALSAPHPTINLFGTLDSIVIKVQPNGTRWIVFASGGAGNKVNYANWSAGTWGADTNLITGTVIIPSDLAMEAGGIIHGICQDQHGGPTIFDFYYFQISATGVVSPASIIYTVSTPNAVQNGTSLMAIAGGKLFFPFAELVGADGLIEPFVLVGDNLVTPAWTAINLDPGGAATIPNNTYEARDLVAAQDTNGKATVFWDVISSGIGGNSYIWLAAYNGATFGSPIAFFDSTVTPFPGQPASTKPLYQLSGMPLQKTDGSWTLATNTEFVAHQTVAYVIYTPGSVSPIAVTQPGPGGRRPQPFVPNPFDNCLARDFRLYSQIDYERLGCGRLPECFLTDEREWGLPL